MYSGPTNAGDDTATDSVTGETDYKKEWNIINTMSAYSDDLNHYTVMGGNNGRKASPCPDRKKRRAKNKAARKARRKSRR